MFLKETFIDELNFHSYPSLKLHVYNYQLRRHYLNTLYNLYKVLFVSARLSAAAHKDDPTINIINKFKNYSILYCSPMYICIVSKNILTFGTSTATSF